MIPKRGTRLGPTRQDCDRAPFENMGVLKTGDTYRFSFITRFERTLNYFGILQ